MSLDNGMDAECSTECEEVARLKKLIKIYKPKTPYPCPVCGIGMSLCSSIKGGILVHDCNGKYIEIPKKLKPGQRSVLINKLVGESNT